MELIKVTGKNLGGSKLNFLANIFPLKSVIPVEKVYIDCNVKALGMKETTLSSRPINTP